MEAVVRFALWQSPGNEVVEPGVLVKAVQAQNARSRWPSWRRVLGAQKARNLLPLRCAWLPGTCTTWINKTLQRKHPRRETETRCKTAAAEQTGCGTNGWPNNGMAGGAGKQKEAARMAKGSVSLQKMQRQRTSASAVRGGCIARQSKATLQWREGRYCGQSWGKLSKCREDSLCCHSG